jgi:hypothetical protein
MKHRVLLFIALSCLCFFGIKCSTNLAGGTIETTNGYVVGIVVDENNTPAPDAKVLLVPSTYNPVIDPALSESFFDTTDSDGAFNFYVAKGIYNIQAKHNSETKQLITININHNTDTTAVSPGTLRDIGVMRIIMPDTMDTVNGYVYVKGTDIYRELTNAVNVSDSTISITFNAMPPGFLPEIVYGEKDAGNISMLISDTIIIPSNDTITIDITDTITKPVWLFPCVVGFTQNLADYFGGQNNIKDSIIKQFNASNTVFNAPDVFTGHVRYRADSFYIIPGAVNDEAVAPPSGFALRIIYDGLREGTLGANSYANRWVCHSRRVTDPGGAFGEQGQNLLNWLFGLIRGSKPLDDLKVLPQNNSLNGQGFDPVPSIMSNPSEAGPWDAYNINVINHYKDTFQLGPDIKLSSFPPTMGVYVESNAGQPVNNAAISLYGVVVDAGNVNSSTFIFSGTTGTGGEYVFSDNPYLNSAQTMYDYDNILISAIQGQDTAWAWIPFYDPGNAWFAKSDTVFRQTITMP